MDRGGHATRIETYLGDPSLGEHAVSSRTRIDLGRVKAGDAEVWMPVALETKSHVALFDRRPRHTDEPSGIQTMRILDGTLAFNKRPGAEVFQANHRLPSPVSPVLRQLWKDYDAQGVANRAYRPTSNVAAGIGLVAEPTEGRDWMPFFIGSAALAFVLSMVVWFRHGRRAR